MDFGCYGNDVAILLIGPALESLSPNEESFLSTVVFVGMLCGAYFWGFISDAHGRRAGFIGAGMVIVVTGIISVFSPNYKALLVFRCFFGVGVGGAPVFSTWFLEFIPNSHRGSWMVAMTSFWTVGTILEASLARIVMPRLGWNWLLGLTATPALIILLISGFVPVSEVSMFKRQNHRSKASFRKDGSIEQNSGS